MFIKFDLHIQHSAFIIIFIVIRSQTIFAFTINLLKEDFQEISHTINTHTYICILLYIFALFPKNSSANYSISMEFQTQIVIHPTSITILTYTETNIPTTALLSLPCPGQSHP